MIDNVRLKKLNQNTENIIVNVDDETKICDIYEVLKDDSTNLLHEDITLHTAYKIIAEYLTRLHNRLVINA